LRTEDSCLANSYKGPNLTRTVEGELKSPSATITSLPRQALAEVGGDSWPSMRGGVPVRAVVAQKVTLVVAPVKVRTLLGQSKVNLNQPPLPSPRCRGRLLQR
jgi:hypothetical protein